LSNSVTIIDYGSSNLLSAIRAFKKVGADVNVAQTPEEIDQASRLVVPGVGTFATSMNGLAKLNMIDSIKNFVKTGKPFLGICVGMQIMMDGSEEFGSHEGLGLIPGRVKAIVPTDENGNKIKIPHIGWNALIDENSGKWNGTVLNNIPENSEVYFVHSFSAWPINEENRLADSYYAGNQMAAVVQRDNIFGCQFHPEKSGPIGLSVLQNFIELS
jgi:imidazole glycerol-phosphate synthase subunit HisH